MYVGGNNTQAFFKNKVVKIILIILAILLVVGLVFFFVRKEKVKEMASTESFTYTRTISLTKSKLEDMIVATGVIESQTTSTITSSVNNASIAKINYSVGDYVNEGDVIIELDTTNLNKQISKQSSKVNEQEKSLQDRYNEAKETYDETYNTLSEVNSV